MSISCCFLAAFARSLRAIAAALLARQAVELDVARRLVLVRSLEHARRQPPQLQNQRESLLQAVERSGGPTAAEPQEQRPRGKESGAA